MDAQRVRVQIRARVLYSWENIQAAKRDEKVATF